MNHLSEFLDRWFLFVAGVLCLNFFKKNPAKQFLEKKKQQTKKFFLTLCKQK